MEIVGKFIKLKIKTSVNINKNNEKYSFIKNFKYFWKYSRTWFKILIVFLKKITMCKINNLINLEKKFAMLLTNPLKYTS